MDEKLAVRQQCVPAGQKTSCSLGIIEQGVACRERERCSEDGSTSPLKKY